MPLTFCCKQDFSECKPIYQSKGHLSSAVWRHGREVHLPAPGVKTRPCGKCGALQAEIRELGPTVPFSPDPGPRWVRDQLSFIHESCKHSCGGQPRRHSSTNCPQGTAHASFKSPTMTSMRHGQGRDFLPSSSMTSSSTRHEPDLVPKRQTQAFTV